MIDALHVLLTNLAVSAACFFVLWLISLRTRDPSFVDSWWGLGVVVLAASTYFNVPHSDRALLIAVLASAWGLRLGLYLLWRWRSHGHDRRYAKLAERAKIKGLSFAAFAALWVFLPQLFLQLVMALPAQLGPIDPAPFGTLGHIGAALSAFGILYETIADAQLTAFKADPDNAGKVMDRRYSRHPNYFGDMCVWWGIFLIAAETTTGLWSLPGPLLLTFLLTRVSGAPTTEPHLKQTRPEYEAYKQRTSPFIPLPPKRA